MDFDVCCLSRLKVRVFPLGKKLRVFFLRCFCTKNDSQKLLKTTWMLNMVFALEEVKPSDVGVFCVFDVQISGVQNLFMDGSKDGAKL